MSRILLCGRCGWRFTVHQELPKACGHCGYQVWLGNDARGGLTRELHWTPGDLRFLRSLRIAADSPTE